MVNLHDDGEGKENFGVRMKAFMVEESEWHVHRLASDAKITSCFSSIFSQYFL